MAVLIYVAMAIAYAYYVWTLSRPWSEKPRQQSRRATARVFPLGLRRRSS